MKCRRTHPTYLRVVKYKEKYFMQEGTAQWTQCAVCTHLFKGSSSRRALMNSTMPEEASPGFKEKNS